MGRTFSLILIPILIIVSIMVPRTMAFLPASFALIAYLSHLAQKREFLLPDLRTALFLTGIFLLSSLSFFWADFPENVLNRATSIAGYLLMGIIMLSIARQWPRVEEWPLKKIMAAAVLTVSMCGLFLFIEYALNLPVARAITDNNLMSSYWNRSMVVLTLSVVPCLYLLEKNYGHSKKFFVGAAGLLLCTGSAALVTQSQTAQILLIMAVVGYFLYKGLSRYLLGLTAGLTVIMVLLTPLIPGFLQQKLEGVQGGFAASASMPHRLEVWNFVADEIKMKPWLGHGVESVRSMTSPHIMPHIQSNSILHPHNAFLQIWVEMGLAGALLVSAFLLYLFYKIYRSPRQDQPLYYAVLVSSLAMVSTGYGLWQSWQIGLLLTVSAFCIMCARILPPPKS